MRCIADDGMKLEGAICAPPARERRERRRKS
jgi:hypothetical protein